MDYEEMIKYRDENNPYASHLGIITTEIRPGYAKGELVLEPYHINAVGEAVFFLLQIPWAVLLLLPMELGVQQFPAIFITFQQRLAIKNLYRRLQRSSMEKRYGCMI